MLWPVMFLIISNAFMTFAWYGHLKYFSHLSLIAVIFISWGVAFFEYCFQVPANRLGYGVFTLPQLKILQEVITLAVFAGFAIVFMGVPLTRNFVYASLCMIAAVYFIFRDGLPSSL